ncbi:MAG: hypothetical protein ABIZ18_01225 [Caldimonas sp.]
MTVSRVGWSETWRVLVYTAAIALAFILLRRFESGTFTLFGIDDRVARAELASPSADAELAREAERIAQVSRDALAQAPGRRLAAFRLGYELGYSSTLIGSFSNSAPEVQAKVRPVGDRHLAIARSLATELGIGRVELLPAQTLGAYAALDERFEADENGVGAQVEARLSPLHRELYVLGTLVGGETADVESSSGTRSQPPGARIRRRATLAGVERVLWMPLALTPQDTPPAQVIDHWHGALDVLVADLARRDAAAGALAAPR